MPQRPSVGQVPQCLKTKRRKGACAGNQARGHNEDVRLNRRWGAETKVRRQGCEAQERQGPSRCAGVCIGAGAQVPQRDKCPSAGGGTEEPVRKGTRRRGASKGQGDPAKEAGAGVKKRRHRGAGAQAQEWRGTRNNRGRRRRGPRAQGHKEEKRKHRRRRGGTGEERGSEGWGRWGTRRRGAEDEAQVLGHGAQGYEYEDAGAQR